MLTFLFHLTVRPEREAEWRERVGGFQRAAQTEDDGCIAYAFYRRSDSPREYVLFEQWRDGAAIQGHVARLQRVLGPPREGGQLPAAFLDFFERTELVRYDAVE
jgi:quinol monooxygenase YgiN